MDIRDLLDNVRNLTDLELAILLSLIAQQHCLITCEDDSIDDLSSELALITFEIFNLSYTVISPEDTTCVEKFGEAILDPTPNQDFGQNQPSDSAPHTHPQHPSTSIHTASIPPSGAGDLDSRVVANIVIAKNFNQASEEVQIAALELITRRRIYSHTTVHQVPRVFLFIPLISTSTKHVRLNTYLNDRISISHHHDSMDGFVNLEELDPGFERAGNIPRRASVYDDDESVDSLPVSVGFEQTMPSRRIHYPVIEKLRQMGNVVAMTPEIRRYAQDVIVFLRLARGVDGGVSPFATTQVVNLAKYLAPLHGISFVTPSLVALAARKVYSHRIVIASPERERSLQWGSDTTAVRDMLSELTPETVIEEVLLAIPSPV